MGGVVVARDELVPALFIGGLVAYSAYEVTKRIAPRPSALPTPWGIAYQQVAPIPQRIPILDNPPAITSVQGRIVMDDNRPNVLGANDAYKALREGRLQWVKSQKISKYFTWADVLSSDTQRRIDNFRSMPLSACQKATSHARLLDDFRERVGSPLTIISWWRSKDAQIAIYRGQYGSNYPLHKIPLNSRHIFGDGTDFAGNYQQKRHYENVAIQMGWPSKYGGMGYSRNPRNPRFHLDSRGRGVGSWQYD